MKIYQNMILIKKHLPKQSLEYPKMEHLKIFEFFLRKNPNLPDEASDMHPDVDVLVLHFEPDSFIQYVE